MKSRFILILCLLIATMLGADEKMVVVGIPETPFILEQELATLQGLGGRIHPAMDGSGWIFFARSDDQLGGIHLPSGLSWTLPIPLGEQSMPVVGSDGKVFLLDREGWLHTLNHNGMVMNRWENDRFIFPPVLDPSHNLYLISQSQAILSFNKEGSLRWQHPLPLPVHTIEPLAGPKGTLYLASDKTLYAWEPKGGKIWSVMLDQPISTPITMGADHSLYFGSADGSLYAVNYQGVLQWQVKLEGKPVTQPVIDNEGVIFVATESGTLYGIHKSGTIRWQVTLPGETLSHPTLTQEGILFAGSTRGVLRAFSTKGEIVGRWDLEQPIFTNPLPKEGKTLYLATSKLLLKVSWHKDHGGLAHSSWPTYRFNLSRAGHSFQPTIARLPDQAYKPQPEDKARLSTTTVTLQWETEATDVQFDLYWGKDPQPPLYRSGVSEMAFVLTDLVPGTRYYWKIVTHNPWGSIDSPVWTFEIQPASNP